MKRVERIKQLEDQITLYNNLYRKGESEISDEEYDLLKEELATLDKSNPLILKGVIESQPDSRKEKLPIHMGSLNKVKTFEELMSWVDTRSIRRDEEIVITPKLDGISLVSGKRAWTRGDGEYGQNCTSHYLSMNYINPGSKRKDEEIITYGEAIIKNNDFTTLFSESWATARNMVAGLLNRDEVAEEVMFINYIRYGVAKDWDKVGQLMYCNELNAVQIPYQLLPLNEITEELLNSLYKEWSEEYRIDGLVLDINSCYTRQRLGREVNMNPAYAIAYKSPKWSTIAVSRVTGISWEVSKNGKLKPVIGIQPIQVNGVTISNITGYNAAYVYDNHIAEGSTIELTRSGDVIPKHLNTISYDEDKLVELMDEMTCCPSCGNPTRWDNTMTELVCTCPTCKQKRINSMVHFFRTVGVEEFGKPSVEQLYEEGYDSIQSMLRVTQEELSGIPGWGEKSARVVTDQFRKLRESYIPLARLMHALDLFEGKLGEKDAQLVLDNLTKKEREEFMNPNISLTEDFSMEICRINGVAEVTAAYFTQGRNLFNALWGFDNTLVKFEAFTDRPTGGKLEGVSFCMTGFRDANMERVITDNGGKVSSGVSKNLAYLVVKDLSSTSSKMDKAKKDGVKIITIEGFNKLLLENSIK